MLTCTVLIPYGTLMINANNNSDFFLILGACRGGPHRGGGPCSMARLTPWLILPCLYLTCTDPDLWSSALTHINRRRRRNTHTSKFWTYAVLACRLSSIQTLNASVTYL